MKTTLKIRMFLALLLLVPSVMHPAHSEETYSSDHVIEVASDGLTSNCLDYCFVGICVWLKCTLLGCDIETSPRIRHHLPDLVVSAHKTPGNIPWEEAKTIYESPAMEAMALLTGLPLPTHDGGQHHVNLSQGKGSRGEEFDVKPHDNLFFKDVSVTGSPAAGVLEHLDYEYICPTQAVLLHPYFISEFDTLAWRSGALFGPEVIYPASFIPGLREVGAFAFNSWGPIHPRHGFVLTNEEPKGAAVLAQRGIDIVTRDHQPHVYDQLEPSADAGHIGLVIKESNEDNDHWQMLSPVADSSCDAFGHDTNYALERSSQSGNYSWLYWPEYACCIPKAGILLYYFETEVSC